MSGLSTIDHSPFLISRLADRVFRWSSIWMAALAVYFVTVFVAFDSLLAGSATGLMFRIAGACLGTVGAFAAIILFFGMLIFMFRYDRSSAGAKAGWIVLFAATASFGSALYYWAVYRRQNSGLRLH